LKHYKYILIMLLLLPTLVFANGGEIDLSDVDRTGNIRLLANQSILLEKEELNIVLDGDYANVLVEYTFRNTGDAQDVDYGFPVDVRNFNSDEMWDELSKKLKDTVSGFTITDGSSKILPIKLIQGEERTVHEQNWEYQIFTRWYTTRLHFPANTTSIVRVSYRVKCGLSDMLYTKSFRPRFSDRRFIYRLSPSGNWGTGLVKEFSARIDPRKMIDAGGIIKSISLDGYKNQDGIIEWKIENADLKALNTIEVVYDNSASAMSRYIKENRISNRSVREITASSILKSDKAKKITYKPQNTLDSKANTSWVEGAHGDGIGEWIEVELKHVALSAIGIINGYPKKESLYKANNRIKKLKLEVSWSDGRLYKAESVIELNERQFNTFNSMAEAPFIDWLSDYGEAFREATRIRITILEVYKGTKYRDTPISEIVILGREPGKRKIQLSTDSKNWKSLSTISIQQSDPLLLRGIDNGRTSPRWYWLEPVNKVYNNMNFEPTGQEKVEAIEYKLRSIGADTILDFSKVIDKYGPGTYNIAFGDPNYSWPPNKLRQLRPLYEIYPEWVVQIVVRKDNSYLGRLSELRHAPFIIAPTITPSGIHQTDASMGSDCASMAIYGKRRQGWSIPYAGPKGILKYLDEIQPGPFYLQTSDDKTSYRNRAGREATVGQNTLAPGDIIHFGEQVSVFYSDRGIPGVLDPEDQVFQSFETFPQIVSIKDCGFSEKWLRIFRWKQENKRKKQ